MARSERMTALTTVRSVRDGLSRRPLVIWGIGVGVYLLAVFHRTSLGVAGPQAAQRLDLSAGQLSTFVMLQLGVYAAMQVPTGILVDRFGPRRMLLVATIIMGSAEGNVAGHDREKKVGLNVYRKKKRLPKEERTSEGAALPLTHRYGARPASSPCEVSFWPGPAFAFA